MDDFAQVVTTVGSEEEAERLARGIAGARLAVCVQIVGPTRSFYWWQGALKDAREWQLVIKAISSEEQLAEVAAYIKANHSYDIPEISAIPVLSSSEEYTRWISAEMETGAS
jgi:periplasmic divalent cation tolerance protein